MLVAKLKSIDYAEHLSVSGLGAGLDHAKSWVKGAMASVT
jgi:hypothetical protein